MGLLKKKKKKKSKRSFARMSGRGAANEISGERPKMVKRTPPCRPACPSGNDIRGWLTVIAQQEKLGLSEEEAWDRAWYRAVETNPFPATMGRICPHPCEESCNRKEKDSAVAINSVERAIGDWGIDRELSLRPLDGPSGEGSKVAVVGSGPSGLSCAYHLSRRGHEVTVFEAFQEAGGMLRFGIPEYRLPRSVLNREIDRIRALGVKIEFGVTIGEERSVEDLQNEFDAIFIGIGAHRGKTMGIPGEKGPGVWTGTDFLNRANRGEELDLGEKVVIVGGGDTAVDAARVSLRLAADAAGVSRRMGAEVKVLYRRTRAEMPAIAQEIEEAVEEGVQFEFLVAPCEIVRDEEGRIERLRVQRMELGEPDDSGRRRPVPIEGEIYETEADAVIMAVSQKPDWKQLGAVVEEGSWLEVDNEGKTEIEGIWSGGDALTLGLATISIGQGRLAAESIHAALTGAEYGSGNGERPVRSDELMLDYYDARARAEREVVPPAERFENPKAEVDLGISHAAAALEAERCMSCGACFGCENCWMYCQNNGFTRVDDPLEAGRYFELNSSLCDGCKKCAEQCPCGYLVMG